MTLLVGAAAVLTLALGSSPLMLLVLVGLWMGIIWAITILVRDYQAIGR
jgi:hypothetical protein